MNNLDKEIEDLEKSHYKEKKNTSDKNESHINKLESEIIDLKNYIFNRKKDKEL